MSGFIPTNDPYANEAWIPLPKKRTDSQLVQWSESDNEGTLSDSPAVCPQCGAGPASGSRRASRRLSR